ncbi:hypothetical protein Q1695_016269 [Nippostrongylus brasiliensis]|nr:hypothetical protein Q1695_016269 [Nippostrongylus brasiliensis]
MLRRHNKPGGSPSQQNSVFIAEGVRVKPSHYIAEDLATQGAQATTPAPAENAAAPGAVPSNVTASRSQGSMHSGRNCGYFVFLAITLLTCIHNSIRAMLVGYGASDWSILKFCAMSELLLTIAVFILKVVSITFAEKVCIRIACLAVMVVYLILSILVAINWSPEGEGEELQASSTRIGSIFAICMDILIYLLYLRIKSAKLD